MAVQEIISTWRVVGVARIVRDSARLVKKGGTQAGVFPQLYNIRARNRFGLLYFDQIAFLGASLATKIHVL